MIMAVYARENPNRKERMPVLTSKQQKKPLKRRKIRYTEYYDLQSVLDGLYTDSLNRKTFTRLMDIIQSPENIQLAYRTIKGNKGSHTPGVDGRTIHDLASLRVDQYVALVQRQFSWYKPHPVRRVEIPKPNGKTRPLGIPTILDRIVQQCVLQVLEPICEAKFHSRSNGFRPNRSTEHAMAQCYRMMQTHKLHYVVDIDIKGFFDNVHHGKLIRQIWNMGIQDKTLLCIIKAMLKAQVVLPNGETITPTKGTPQGGILSPLLSNIVLNELDWWVSSQWEDQPTHYPYKHRFNKRGSEIKSHTYRALRQSRLKEMHIVRYADDFKIFCRNHTDAVRAYEATKLWLKDRLGLDISPEKSVVINHKQHYSDFLGFKMKVCKRGGKMLLCSHISDKAARNMREKLSAIIKEMAIAPNKQEQFKAVLKYNAAVVGMHDYYCLASKASYDFYTLAYPLKKQMHSRLKGLTRNGELKQDFIKERYGKSKQLRFLWGHPIIPIGYVQNKKSLDKAKRVNRYSAEGRAGIHKNLGIETGTLIWMMHNPAAERSIEYADNRLSLFAAQYGKCAITGAHLLPHDVHCHHKTPVKLGGSDDYGNLVLVTEAVHKLIHATAADIVDKYLQQLQPPKDQLAKLNKMRIWAGIPAIT